MSGTGEERTPTISLEKYIDKVTDSIQQEIDRRISTLSALMEQRFVTVNERLEGMNGYKQQLNEERGTYVTRSTLDLILQNLRENGNQDKQTKNSGSQNWITLTGVMCSVALSAVSLIITLVLH